MKLDVVVTDVSQCRKDLAVEVPVAEVKAEYDKAYDAYARYAKVPGFRPGRVPRGVVKQRFSKEVKDEVIGQLLPHALGHAIEEQKLRVIGEPRLQDVSVSENEPLKFKVSLEVLPEFELKEYKNIKVTKRVARVTDENVDAVLQRMREGAAEFVPVEDRSAQDGDFVSINLVGKYDDPQAAHEHEDLKADDVQIELNGANVQPEFNEHLRGVQTGEVREFRVSYPEDFGSQGLAGKTLDFTATVVAVRQKELPELDDDFAGQFGEYQSLEDMRAKLRAELEQEAEGRAQQRLRGELLTEVLKEYDFEVPEVMVEQQASERAQEFAYMLLRSGAAPEMIREINWREQMEFARASAQRDVRAAMVVSRIGAAENVIVSDEEIDAEIDRLAEAQGEPAEQVKARLTKEEAISSIANRLNYQKSLDVIVNHADITTEEISESEEAALANPAAAQPVADQPQEAAPEAEEQASRAAEL